MTCLAERIDLDYAGMRNEKETRKSREKGEERKNKSGERSDR